MSYWQETIEISITATPWHICVPKTLEGVGLAKAFLKLMKKKLKELQQEVKT